MRLRLAFVMLFLFGLFVEPVASEEILDYKNLEGLQKVNEIMTVGIRVSGTEPFDIEETKIRINLNSTPFSGIIFIEKSILKKR